MSANTLDLAADDVREAKNICDLCGTPFGFGADGVFVRRAVGVIDRHDRSLAACLDCATDADRDDAERAS